MVFRILQGIGGGGGHGPVRASRRASRYVTEEKRTLDFASPASAVVGLGGFYYGSALGRWLTDQSSGTGSASSRPIESRVVCSVSLLVTPEPKC